MAAAVKYADGTFGMGVEWIHDRLRDRMRLLSTNPLKTSLFRNKAGDSRNGVILTEFDTNNQDSRVPVQQKWYLWSLKMQYQAEVLANDAYMQLIMDLFRTTIVRLTIQNLDKIFDFLLADLVGGDLYVTQPAATIYSNAPRDNGTPWQWEMKIPVVLEQNAIWYLDFIQQSASSATLDNDFVEFVWERELYRQGA